MLHVCTRSPYTRMCVYFVYGVRVSVFAFAPNICPPNDINTLGLLIIASTAERAYTKLPRLKTNYGPPFACIQIILSSSSGFNTLGFDSGVCVRSVMFVLAFASKNKATERSERPPSAHSRRWCIVDQEFDEVYIDTRSFNIA